MLGSNHSSIAEACRRLGVNRSQFNRYLNEQTQPSLRLPHEQFKTLILLKPQGADVEIDRNRLVSEVEQVFQASLPRLDTYAGYYFTYYNSMSNPGKVLKGLTRIYRTPLSMNLKTLEVIGRRGHGGFTCKYEGGCFKLGDRFFITAMEMLPRNAAIQIILNPSYTSRIRTLSCIMSGVSAHATRPPAATQIALQFLGPRVALRRSLAACGLFEPESDEIPPQIRNMIAGEPSTDSRLLAASPG